MITVIHKKEESTLFENLRNGELFRIVGHDADNIYIKMYHNRNLTINSVNIRTGLARGTHVAAPVVRMAGELTVKDAKDLADQYI